VAIDRLGPTPKWGVAARGAGVGSVAADAWVYTP